MSPFQYNTYKKIYQGSLSQGSQYLIDFVLPNPENGIPSFIKLLRQNLKSQKHASLDEKIGIFQTKQIKEFFNKCFTSNGKKKLV